MSDFCNWFYMGDWAWLYWVIGIIVGISAGREFWETATHRHNGAVVMVYIIAVIAWPVFAFVYFLRAWIKK
jgi:hypothetical protein